MSILLDIAPSYYYINNNSRPLIATFRTISTKSKLLISSAAKYRILKELPEPTAACLCYLDNSEYVFVQKEHFKITNKHNLNAAFLNKTPNAITKAKSKK